MRKKSMNFKILIACMLVFLPITENSNQNTAQRKGFPEEVKNLEKKTQELCTFIETKSIFQANEFLKHLHNAHTKCPDLDKMNNRLLNMLDQAKKHRSGLIEEFDSCKKLSDMLSNGLENANLVIFYLTEGNYTLVKEILGNWHQKFENFRFSFYPRNTALEIISENSLVFYYDNWSFGLFWFIVGWALMIISIGWMIIGINNVYRYCLEKRPSERNQTNEEINIHNRGVNRPEVPFRGIDSNN
jgi:hypothetical protein